MAAKKSVPRLTDGEMEILQMLWREGAVTLSEAHRSLGRPIGYTTVQTRLNRLVEKKVVRRSKERPARYEAAVEPSVVGGRHLEMLLKRVSGGSIIPLVAHLVADRSLTPAEIKELKQLVADAETRNRSKSRKEKSS